MTTASTEPTARPRAASPDDELAAYVGRRASTLYAGYRRDDPRYVADLARLRTAVGTDPGSELATYAVVFGDGYPEVLQGRADTASAPEWATHAALTLFALHQQSKRDRAMHARGTGLGRAVRTLADRGGAEGVRRRYHALGTATSREATLHHLRGLVTLMRAEAVPLDYGRLAVDLRRLQSPRSAGQVRLQWGRDHQRRPRDPDAPPTTDQPAPRDPSTGGDPA